ncbi:MAG: glycosyl transferase [Burkholderiales bacterium]|nr:MAG: glycosyl transferase [Burkholderiales bacterium]
MPPSDIAGPALAAAAIAACVAAAVLATLLASGLSHRMLDRPNARSMHVTPTPRIGGLGVLAGLVAALAATRGALPWAAWAALATVAAVSTLDDLRGLGAGTRLALHLAAATTIAVSALGGHGALTVAAGALAIAWLVNLYNFMDGSDALAGTMGVVGFGACALAAAAGGDAALAVASAAVAGACAGFLVFNLPPARLFMGDAGSTSLGLLAGAIGAVGVERDLWSPWLPATVFMPFAFDATATLLDRARRGCRVWEAHREHAYQRLNLSGFGHRRTALAYGALMLANAALALGARQVSLEGAALVVSLLVHGVLWLAVQRAWRRREDAADAADARR